MRTLASLIVLLIGLVGVVDAQPKDPPKTYTNTIGMKFAYIPPGTFIMGSPATELDRKDDETQHKVTLTKGFYMGVHTVTKEQWKAVMGKVPGSDKVLKKNLPVEKVSWDDCQEFIKKLQKKDQKPYRLPTEAEWEYACRAATTTPYYVGNTLTTRQANFGKFKKGMSPLNTTPVGSYPPNPWGLYDMNGNVWQWCHDWYGAYPKKELVDPQGHESGDERVLRGGSFTDDPRSLRSATRHHFEPNGRDQVIGFRICFFAE